MKKDKPTNIFRNLCYIIGLIIFFSVFLSKIYSSSCFHRLLSFFFATSKQKKQSKITTKKKPPHCVLLFANTWSYCLHLFIIALILLSNYYYNHIKLSLYLYVYIKINGRYQICKTESQLASTKQTVNIEWKLVSC